MRKGHPTMAFFMDVNHIKRYCVSSLLTIYISQ